MYDNLKEVDIQKKMKTASDIQILSNVHNLKLFQKNLYEIQQQFVFQGHTDSVNKILIDYQRNVMYSCSLDSNIKVWCLNTKKEKLECRMNDHQDTVYNLRLTKDNNTLISISRDSTIRFWDLNTFKEKVDSRIDIINQDTKQKFEYIYIKKFLVDRFEAKLFVLTNKILIYDIKTKHLYTISLQKDIQLFQFDNYSKKLYTSQQDKTLQVWNLKNLYKTRNYKQALQPEIFQLHKQNMTYFIFDQRYKNLYSCGEDSSIIKWNLKNMKSEFTLNAQTTVKKIFVNKNETRLISQLVDGVIQVWNTEKASLLFEINDGVQDEEKYNIFLDPSQELFYLCTYNGYIKVHSLEQKNIIYKMQQHKGIVNQILFNRNKTKFYSCSDDTKIICWDSFQGKEYKQQQHSVICGKVRYVKFNNRQDRLITVTFDGFSSIWQVSKNLNDEIEFQLIYKFRTGQVKHMYFEKNDEFLITLQDSGSVRIWDIKKLEKLQNFYQQEEMFQDEKQFCLSTSNINLFLFNYDYDDIYIIFDDLQFKKVNLSSENDFEQSYSINSNFFISRYIIVEQMNYIVYPNQQNFQVQIADLAISKDQLQIIKSLHGHKSTILHMKLSEDQNFLYTCSKDKTIGVFYLKNTFQEVPGNFIKLHTDQVNMIQIDFYNNKIYSCSDDSQIYQSDLLEINQQVIANFDNYCIELNQQDDQLDQQENLIQNYILACQNIHIRDKKCFVGHNEKVKGFTFNKNFTQMYSYSTDSQIIAWNTLDQKILFKIKGHERQINQIMLREEMGILLSCSDDRTIKFWNTQNGNIKRYQIKDNEFKEVRHFNQIKGFYMKQNNQEFYSHSKRQVRAWKFNQKRDQVEQLFISNPQREDNIQKMFLSKNEKFIYTISSKGNLLKQSIIQNKYQFCYTMKDQKNKIIKIYYDKEKDILFTVSKNGRILLYSLFDFHKNFNSYKISLDMGLDIVQLLDKKQQILFSSSDNVIRIRQFQVMQTEQMEEIKVHKDLLYMDRHKQQIIQIELNNDQNRAYSLDKETIRIWSTQTGQEYKHLTISYHNIRKIVLKEDQFKLYGILSKGDILVWDISKMSQTGNLLKRETILNQTQKNIHVLFTDDHKKMLTFTSNQKLIVYDLESFQYSFQFIKLLETILSTKKSNSSIRFDRILNYIKYMKHYDKFYYDTIVFLYMCTLANKRILCDYLFHFGLNNDQDLLTLLIKLIVKQKKYISKLNSKQIYKKFDTHQDSVFNKDTETLKFQEDQTLSQKDLFSSNYQNETHLFHIKNDIVLLSNLQKSLQITLDFFNQHIKKDHHISSRDFRTFLMYREKLKYPKQSLNFFFLNFYQKIENQKVQLKNTNNRVVKIRHDIEKNVPHHQQLIEQNFDYKKLHVLYRTKYAIDIRLGSEQSIQFFDILLEGQKDHRIKLSSIINYKWQNIQNYMIPLIFIYFLLAISFNLAILEPQIKIPCLILSLFITIVLIMLEFFTQYYAIKNHKSTSFFINQGDKYNQFDLFVLTLVFIVIILNFFYDKSNYSLNLANLLTIFILNIRAFIELRVFNPLRHLIAMIIQVYYDIRSFLVVFLAYIYIYAANLQSLDFLYHRDKQHVKQKMDVSINLALGEWETTDLTNFWDWVVFLFSAISLMIIMLNLIIAIVSETFSRYNENRQHIDLLEKLVLVNEFDKLIYFFKSVLRKDKVEEPSFHYFQILESENFLFQVRRVF